MGRPEKLLDPICDMVVDIAGARDQGLSIERPEREYAFCSQGCLVKFAKAPSSYIPKVEAWLASETAGAHHGIHPPSGPTPEIDEGIRRWYASCRCCLSEAYPTIVETLDAESRQPSR